MKQSLSQEVYYSLLERLYNSQLMPGELLNRRQVAEELGVSVAPVLEAMLQLENEGILETIPRKGTRVRIIREEDVVGQLIVREALECQAARLYCGKAVIENEAELIEFAREVDAAQETNLEDWKIEIRFHRRLVELARCPMLTAEFDRTMRLSIFFGMNKLIPPHARTKRDNHERLVKDLQVLDPEMGDKVMRKHLMVGKDYIFKEYYRKLDEKVMSK